MSQKFNYKCNCMHAFKSDLNSVRRDPSYILSNMLGVTQNKGSEIKHLKYMFGRSSIRGIKKKKSMYV